MTVWFWRMLQKCIDDYNINFFLYKGSLIKSSTGLTFNVSWLDLLQVSLAEKQEKEKSERDL